MKAEITDLQVLAVLEKHGMNKDYVELYRDYCAEYPCAKFYRDLQSGKRIALISVRPVVTDDGERISAKWLCIGIFFFTDNNLFTAVVEQEDDAVRATYKDRDAQWRPEVYLNGIKKERIGSWQITRDESILEMDYGICHRELVLRNGAILEYYIFDKDPQGEVRIKSNYKGDLQPRKYWARDGSGKRLKGFETCGDEKIIPASAFKEAVYPITVDDSLTFYTNACDCEITYDGDDYSTVHDAAVGSVEGGPHFDVGQFYENDEGEDVFEIFRGCVYFDTSSLDDDLVIDTATLWLYCISDDSDTNFDLTIQSGMPTYPHEGAEDADYNYTYYSGNGGSENSSAFGNNEWVEVDLNATGIGWINKTGTTKFMLRSSRDINGDEPTESESGQFATTDYSGGDYTAKLIITYTPTGVSRPLVNGSLVNTGLVNGVLVR